MALYSDVKEIKVISNPDEVNRLRKNGWIYKRETIDENGNFIFLLERRFYNSVEEFHEDCERERKFLL